MVMRRSSVPAPPGFSLVEAIVALTLLTIGVLGAAATQSLAARLLREAESRADAVSFAGSILDSLLMVPAPAGGVRDQGRHRARWSTEARGRGTLVELEVEYLAGAGTRVVRFEMLHLSPLPRIGEE